MGKIVFAEKAADRCGCPNTKKNRTCERVEGHKGSHIASKRMMEAKDTRWTDYKYRKDRENPGLLGELMASREANQYLRDKIERLEKEVRSLSDALVGASREIKELKIDYNASKHMVEYWRHKVVVQQTGVDAITPNMPS